MTQPVSPFPTSLDLSRLTPCQAQKFAADLIGWHRGTFGDIRMEETPEQKAAREAAEAEAARKATEDAAETARKAAEGRGPGTDGGKPISEMTDAEKAAYFESKASRYKSTLRDQKDYDEVKAERDRLRQATLSDAEKAIEAARAEERDKVTKDVSATYRDKLVKSEVKAALAGKVPPEKVTELLQFLDPTKFLAENGEVDTELVEKYAGGFAPGRSWPDLGGGSRGTHGTSKGVDAGRELYAATRGKSTTNSEK